MGSWLVMSVARRPCAIVEDLSSSARVDASSEGDITTLR
jgi:hypothetical protein